MFWAGTINIYDPPHSSLFSVLGNCAWFILFFSVESGKSISKCGLGDIKHADSKRLWFLQNIKAWMIFCHCFGAKNSFYSFPSLLAFKEKRLSGSEAEFVWPPAHPRLSSELSPSLVSIYNSTEIAAKSGLMFSGVFCQRKSNKTEAFEENLNISLNLFYRRWQNQNYILQKNRPLCYFSSLSLLSKSVVLFHERVQVLFLLKLNATSSLSWSSSCSL